MLDESWPAALPSFRAAPSYARTPRSRPRPRSTSSPTYFTLGSATSPNCSAVKRLPNKPSNHAHAPVQDGRRRSYSSATVQTPWPPNLSPISGRSRSATEIRPANRPSYGPFKRRLGFKLGTSQRRRLDFPAPPSAGTLEVVEDLALHARHSRATSGLESQGSTVGVM